ncbi:apses-domain-containing protein [Microstroma glucosiphilum]|uniref:Apses-domain-containing protein n=1 Tax=Pseudomicrostroma glucosiphilum TaxID=1684307 RepID=A0A316U3Q3_9BASI|nr:apses-domain-containing protein [Pseudomicrostroma glucosiphilum]PWN19926.1 apses-domain-containing protein [Pseudomicrostroma glucosiphilum]
MGGSFSAEGASSAPQPTVYLATYSNVPVYEMTIRGIAVMRRRTDGFLNATQILKVAGIEKAKRTKILEKEILTGEHEKVQGGYGKYQGTWIPLKRAQELAGSYNVAHLLRPVLEFDPRTADQVPTAGPKKRPNPNAPANSSYFKNGPGAVKSSTPKSSGSAAPEASTLRAPTQQPRFLQLRAPPSASTSDEAASGIMAPGSASLIGALSASGGTSGTEGIPPGSTPSMRQALSNYSQFGYTPQGVPLPSSSTTAVGKRAERDADDSMESMQGREAPAKRARAGSPGGSPPSRAEVPMIALGPSPVKDLSALAGPDSSLRGASHPRPQQVALGPPDELVRRSGGTRFADRPRPVKAQDEGERRMRDRLIALFMGSEGDVTAISLGGSAPASSESGPAPCVDAVIDDHGHTALHWAAALCKLPLVSMLVARPVTERGANLHAGNYAGETALHRSVLVTNAYDSSNFPDLLEILAPSLHTRDFKNRTVLHHIALVAALKGRATPARYYLASVLEYIAKKEGGKFASLVDAQDEDGETALGIAARQGNNSMVKMLLEVGARKDLSNIFGLRPSDWGIDGGSTSGGPSDLVTSLMRPPQPPIQKSQDVLTQLRSLLDELTSTSAKELAEKQEALQVTQSHLQSATRELTSRRKGISTAMAKVAELEERKLRVGNLKRRLFRVVTHGVESGGGAPAVEGEVEEEASPALITELLRLESDFSSSSSTSPEEGLVRVRSEDLSRLSLSPSQKQIEHLLLTRFLHHHFTLSNDSLRSATEAVQVEARQKEEKCRRVVSMYSRIEETQVEEILDELVAAVESNAEVDLARVAGFLARTGGTVVGLKK